MTNSLFLQGKQIYVNPNLAIEVKSELEEQIIALGGKLVPTVNSNVIAITTSRCLQPKELYKTPTRATPDWIRMMAKHGRDYKPKYFSADRKMIFSGFIVHFHNQDSNKHFAEKLYGAVAALGGQYRIHADSDLTHLITNNDHEELPKQYQNSKVVLILPEFFDDCFRLNLLCNESYYTFPDPKIHRLDISEIFKNSSLDRKASSTNQASEISLPILNGQIIYIDASIFESHKDGNQNRLNMIAVLEKNGAVVTDSFDNASVLCIDEQVSMFQKAVQKRLVIGTVRWFKDQIKQQKLLNTDPVLYYPRPNVFVPEFSKFNITVTNYSGQAREDILKMASHLGATVTRNMTISNTHLICGAPIGDKYLRALKWNINIVNHIWLEESYSKWKYIVEARPRFLQFSPGIGEYVGNSETRIPEIIPEPEQQPVVKQISIIQKRKVLDENDFVKRIKNNPIKIVFTGMRSKDIRKNDINALKDLEIYIAEDLSQFDYLITKKLARSEKLLISIARGCPILDYSWLESCIIKNERQDITNYYLNDLEFEKKFKFSLKKSLELARKQPIFKNQIIIVTANTVPAYESMQRIIDSAGGDCILISNVEEVKGLFDSSTNKPIIISCPQDIEIVEELKKSGFSVYDTEFLLCTILKQKLEFNSEMML